jgi:hypothetical protein
MGDGSSIRGPFDEADMPTRTPHSKTQRSQRDRDWRNGVLLIAGIVGVPVMLAALAAVIWS